MDIKAFIAADLTHGGGESFANADDIGHVIPVEFERRVPKNVEVEVQLIRWEIK